MIFEKCADSGKDAGKCPVLYIPLKSGISSLEIDAVFFSLFNPMCPLYSSYQLCCPVRLSRRLNEPIVARNFRFGSREMANDPGV
jgi:hypothetical protein